LIVAKEDGILISMNMGDVGRAESKPRQRPGSRWLLAPVAFLVMFLAAPVAAQAADGLSNSNSNNTTINGQTLSFGTTGQPGLPVTRTIYLWSNAGSGGFFNSSTRRIEVDVRLNNGNYERSGGSCESRTPDSGWTFRARLSYRGGSSFRSCTIELRLKAGAPLGNLNTTLDFQQRGTGWGGGSTTSGAASITANVTQVNAPAASITGPEGETGTFDYGEVGVGAFLGRPFTIKNTGTTAIAGDPVISGPSTYSIVSEDCPNPIPINSSCSVSVRYTPTGEDGVENGMLSIAGGGATASISLTGSGSIPTAELEIDQESFDYGDTPSGFPISRAFEITNVGNTRLDLTFATGVGTDPAVFYDSGQGTCGATLAHWPQLHLRGRF
jgi:hypothetical protein